jgi:uncharacterized protein YlxW (UPF0749 family)
VVTGAVCLLAGLLIMVSALNAQGTDLRPGRNTDLVAWQAQSAAQQGLDRQRTGSDTRSIAGGEPETGSDLGSQLARQSALVGLTPVDGPAVTVTLDDAPASVAANGIDPDLLVVHQQDIQAVVNALWSGGAEAMTIQRQRVISTTAVKCVGNTVVLHGIPYAPPYVISAIGDPRRLHSALASSGPVRIYKQYVEVYRLGYTEREDAVAHFPAHEGALDLRFQSAPVIRRPPSPITWRGLSRWREWPGGAAQHPGYRQLRLVRHNLFNSAQIGATVEVWRNDDPRFADPDFSEVLDGIPPRPGPGTWSRPESA